MRVVLAVRAEPGLRGRRFAALDSSDVNHERRDTVVRHGKSGKYGVIPMALVVTGILLRAGPGAVVPWPPGEGLSRRPAAPPPARGWPSALTTRGTPSRRMRRQRER